MSAFVQVARPWQARVQVDAAGPARYLAQMTLQSLNHGMPALRTGGAALAAVGRRDLSSRPAAALLRCLPRIELPEIDTVAKHVRRHWPELAAASDRLPAHAPALSALVLQRSSGRFVFLFGDGPSPLLLLKPASPAGTVDPESVALDLLRDLGVAPRPLPSVAGMLVQEGLPGRPLRVLAPGRPGWSAGYLRDYDELGSALVRIAGSTARRGRPPAVGHLDRALPRTDEVTRHRLEAVREQLRDLDAVCLEHHDLSAQNWVVDGAGFSGLVDWEAAVHTGLPGYDALHSAVALLEHGVALRRWSQREVLREFTRAWVEEPLFARARHWQRECVRAVTGSDELAEPLMTTYFASRLARKLVGGGPALLDVSTVSAMLDVVVTSTPAATATSP